FAWGELHLMNPEHSDFALLRTLLLDSHLQSLRDWTLEFHYENYRTTIMCQNPQIHSNPAAAALAELEAQAKERKRREEQQRKYAGIIPCADPANGSNVSGTDSEAEANQRVFAALETGSDSPPTSASESSSSMIAPGVRDTFNHQLNQHYNLKHKYKRYHPVRASPPNQAQDLQITAVPVDNSPSSSDFDKSGLVPPPSQPQTQRSYEKLKSKKILESLSGTLLKHRNKSSKHNRVHVGGSSGSSGGGNGQIQRVY
ncbi:Cell division control protein 11, partial [Spiromyces aspiralis]